MPCRPDLTRVKRPRPNSLVADQRGAAALEYGILASIIAIVLITIFDRLGSTLSTMFSRIDVSI